MSSVSFIVNNNNNNNNNNANNNNDNNNNINIGNMATDQTSTNTVSNGGKKKRGIRSMATTLSYKDIKGIIQYHVLYDMPILSMEFLYLLLFHTNAFSF